MAEIAGLVVSAVGIAAEGLKLSHTITDFIGTFRNASEEIRLVVSDVQATSEVLEQLKESLNAENQADLNWTSTKSWYQQTKRRIGDCYTIFNEIKALLEAVERPDHIGEDQQNQLRKSDRLKWAFSHQRKAARWQGRLNMLKQDFVWRLQVSRYAQEERDRRLRKRFVEQGRPNRTKASLLEMQISKLSLELSTVKHEEAERLYKAQKITGFVDLGRSLDQDDINNPATDLSVRFDARTDNVKTGSQDEVKAQITDNQEQFRNFQISSDDRLQRHDQPFPGTAFTHIQKRSLSASRVQNNVHVTHSNPEPEHGQETPYQGPRRHRASTASDIWDGDNDKRPNFSESDDETYVFPSTKLTSSPELVNTKSKSPSPLIANIRRGSSPLVNIEALMLEPEALQSHNDNSSILSSANRANLSKNIVIEPENLSPTLLSDTPVKNGANIGLEPRNLVDYHNESQAPADEILSIHNAINPIVIAPDRVSKNTTLTPKNANSATKASNARGSPFLASGVQGKEPQAALHKPDKTADQTSITSTSAPHSQSTQRGIISWRPNFLKSQKKRISEVNKNNPPPPSSQTNSAPRNPLLRQATVESASDTSDNAEVLPGSRKANKTNPREVNNTRPLSMVNLSRSSQVEQPSIRKSGLPPLPLGRTKTFRNDLARSQPPIGTVQHPGANVMPSIVSRDVIDLRVPRRPLIRKQTGGVLAMLEGWVLRRAEPGGGLRERSWSRVTRVLLPITFEEMDCVVRAYGQGGNRFWDEFCNLSRYQQMQIDRLLEDKRSDDPDQRYEWVLAAIKTDPTGAKKMDIVTLQIIVQRRLRVGVLALAANNPPPSTRKIEFSESPDDNKEDDKEDGSGIHKRKRPGHGFPPHDPFPSQEGQLLADPIIIPPVSAAPDSMTNYTGIYPTPHVPYADPPMMSGALPSQGTLPPSVSPYIFKENALHMGIRKPVPRILDWITSSRKKGKRDQFAGTPHSVTRSQLTSDWVNLDNSSSGRYDHNLPGYRPSSGASTQYNYDRILPLFQEFIQDYSRRQYNDNGMPPNAYQYPYPQSTGQYVPRPDVRFDSQAPYVDRREPLQLLNIPETTVAPTNDHAHNLEVDYSVPEPITAIDLNQRFSNANGAIQDWPSFEADGRLQNRPLYGGPPLSPYRGDPTSQVPHIVHQPSGSALDSLIAKYTMLDKNYPTDGESMRITREAAPPAGLANRMDSEGIATDNDSDSNIDGAGLTGSGRQ